MDLSSDLPSWKPALHRSTRSRSMSPWPLERWSVVDPALQRKIMIPLQSEWHRITPERWHWVSEGSAGSMWLMRSVGVCIMLCLLLYTVLQCQLWLTALRRMLRRIRQRQLMEVSEMGDTTSNRPQKRLFYGAWLACDWLKMFSSIFFGRWLILWGLTAF